MVAAVHPFASVLDIEHEMFASGPLRTLARELVSKRDGNMPRAVDRLLHTVACAWCQLDAKALNSTTTHTMSTTDRNATRNAQQSSPTLQTPMWQLPPGRPQVHEHMQLLRSSRPFNCSQAPTAERAVCRACMKGTASMPPRAISSLTRSCKVCCCCGGTATALPPAVLPDSTATAASVGVQHCGRDQVEGREVPQEDRDAVQAGHRPHSANLPCFLLQPSVRNLVLRVRPYTPRP